MNTVLALFFAFGAYFASATTLVFNKELLGGHADLVKVLHGTHAVGTAKLRFLYLLPKVGAAVDEFKTGANGDKALAALKLDAGEKFVHLLGFADCADWLAVAVAVFKNGDVVHKFVAGAKADFAAVADLDAFVTFLKDKVKKPALDGLWPLLPAQHVVFKLHAAL